MHSSISILLVVRNQLVREGLAHILGKNDFTIAHAVATIGELGRIDLADDQIVVFEGGPVFSSEDLAQVEHLIAEHKLARVVLIIGAFDRDLIGRAFKAGIYSCISQDMPMEGMVAIVRLAALDQKVVPKEMVDVVKAPANEDGKLVAPHLAQTYFLSTRELQILECLMAGMSNKLIARTLGVSEAAVKLNVKTLFRKMSVANRTQAAMRAHDLNGTFMR